jgi:hypothetical protein
LKFTRLHSDDDGHTLFDEVELAVERPNRTAPIPVQSMSLVVSTSASRAKGLHRAPRRQFVIVLAEKLEIETSRGQRREFTCGDILYVEDTDGYGHHVRCPDNDATLMILPVADGWRPVRAG